MPAFRRSDRVVIRMFGRDPLKMIQGLATNDVAGRALGESVYTAFLTPKGKMVGDARVVRLDSGDILIEADAAAADNIAAHLAKSVPPLFARFEFTDHAVVRGAPAETGRIAVLGNPFQPGETDLIVPAAGAAEPAPAEVLREQEVRRIEAGEPKWGAELGDDVIPLEAGLRDVAISQNKGCYTGQEVIIRILHRGHVNRHLRGLLLEGSAAPAAGSELKRDGKAVGKVTSAVYSPRLGQVIALAYVRREVDAGSLVDVLDGRAKVVELPFQLDGPKS